MSPAAAAILEKSRADKEAEAERRRQKGRAALERKAARDKSIRSPLGATVELFAFNRHAPVQTRLTGETGAFHDVDNSPKSEWVEGAKMASAFASDRAAERAGEQQSAWPAGMPLTLEDKRWFW